MRTPKDKAPAGQGEGFECTTADEYRLLVDSNAIRRAAATTLARELWIVLQAAKQLAGGYRLDDKDLDRLHAAHQHIMAVLSVMTNREVLL